MKDMNKNQVVRQAVSILAVMGLGVGLTACSSTTSSSVSSSHALSSKSPLNIGVMVALTGGEAAYGIGYEKGIELAIDDINQDGGVLGHKLVPIVEDQGDAATAETVFESLVSSHHVPLVIGVNSGVIVPLVSVAERLKTVLIGPAAGTTALDGLGGSYVYRMIESDTGDANAMATYLKSIGAPKVATVAESGSETSTPVAAFVQEYPTLGGTLGPKVSVLSGQSSYTTAADAVASSGVPWVLVSAGVNTGSSYLKALFGAGYKGKVMLYSSSVVPQMISAVGASLMNGRVYGDLAIPTTTLPAYESYAAQWQAKYHSSVAPYSQEAYAGMVTAALAMVSAHGVSGSSINRGMRQVSGTGGIAVDSFGAGVKALEQGKRIHYVSPIGPVVFSAHGSAQTSYGIWEVKNGKFSLVYSVPVS